MAERRMMIFSATFLAILLAGVSEALPDPNLAIFYPYNSSDSSLPRGDEIVMRLSGNFPFYGKKETNIHIITDGLISFRHVVVRFNPDLTVSTLTVPAILVYWSDVDTTQTGRIYYRNATDAALLSRASRDIQAAFPSRFYFFQARWILVVTWHNVTFWGVDYRLTTIPVNTFQAVLVTDSNCSFLILNYGRLMWTTAKSSRGRPARVGFTAGNGRDYFQYPASGLPNVINIWTASNVNRTGQWIFNLNSCLPPAKSCSSNGNTGQVPWFDCPQLRGPAVVDRTRVDFYCDVVTTVTDSRARFEVSFLLNNRTDSDLAAVTVTAANLRATLDGTRLRKKLGKWLSCQVVSYWSNTPTRRSAAGRSTNSYWCGIQVSGRFLKVSESDKRPSLLYLKSTLPITCAHSTDQPSFCNIKLRISSTPDIAARQRSPGVHHTSCSYTIFEDDWKQGERLAYNVTRPLEVIAKVDAFFTATRTNCLRFTVQYTTNSMWSDYQLQPDVIVYRDDSSRPLAKCTATGDPHHTTFNGLYYDTYATGIFWYARTTTGWPFEVQVRQRECEPRLSCVCGIAMREGDIILVVDKCDERNRNYTFKNKDLPEGAGITTNTAGNQFKMQIMSANKILAAVYSWGMNLQLYVHKTVDTDGLCGSIGGSRDYIRRGDNRQLVQVTHHSEASEELINSWRVPEDKDLFDMQNILLTSQEKDDSPETFCMCKGTFPICGGRAISDKARYSWEPDRDANAQLAGGGRRRPSTFNESANYHPRKRSDVNEAEARAECRNRIVNVKRLGQYCYSATTFTRSIDTVIQKCVDDVLLTGNYSWADDKVAELQRDCIDDIVAGNYSANDTQAVIDLVNKTLTEKVLPDMDCGDCATITTSSWLSTTSSTTTTRSGFATITTTCILVHVAIANRLLAYCAAYRSNY